MAKQKKIYRFTNTLGQTYSRKSSREYTHMVVAFVKPERFQNWACEYDDEVFVTNRPDGLANIRSSELYRSLCENKIETYDQLSSLHLSWDAAEKKCPQSTEFVSYKVFPVNHNMSI